MSETISPTTDDSSRRLTRYVCALIIVVSAATSLASVLGVTHRFNPRVWPDRRTPFFSANDRSRWCTVWALVERGTYQIDEIVERPGWETIDKVRWQGHFYSSKPTLLPTLVAGVYWAVKQSTGWTLDDRQHAHSAAHAVLFIVNWIPWVISLVLLAVISDRYARTGLGCVFVVATAAWGTFLTTFVNTLNNHTAAAWSIVFALYPAMRIMADGKRNGWRFALAGLFAAFAVTNELPACVFGAAMFVMLVRTDLKKTLCWFVPAALIPLAGFFYTTYLASGGWIPFYAYFGTEVYEYVHEGMPSYWMNPAGIDAGGDGRLTYLFHCLIGHHGILSLSPVFLLTVVGWCYGRRFREFPLRSFSWLGLGLTLWLLTFVVIKTNNYGGNTSGLRWAFWLIPFWLVTMIPVIDEWGHRRSFRILAAVLLSISVFSAAFPRVNPWQSPWLMDVLRNWGMIDYRTGKRPEHILQSWIPSLPEQSEADQSPFIEFEGVSHLGQTMRLRLTSIGDVNINGESVRHVRAVRQAGYGAALETLETIELYLRQSAIEEGHVPRQCLVWPAEATAREKRIAEIFLQGMPAQRRFYYGNIRYLKTPLQDDAIECRLAASQIRYTLPGSSRKLLYRRQVWLSDRVQFGVLQFEDTVTDEATNEVLYRQRLTASVVSSLREPNVADAD